MSFFDSPAWRIAFALAEGKFVIRKLGPHWYLMHEKLNDGPVKVPSQEHAIVVVSGVVRYFRWMRIA